MAVDVLKYMSKSDIERMWYEDEILAEIDQEAEIDHRVKKRDIEIAKKMLAKNKPIDEIIEFTDLTEDEIREIEKTL